MKLKNARGFKKIFSKKSIFKKCAARGKWARRDGRTRAKARDIFLF